MATWNKIKNTYGSWLQSFGQGVKDTAGTVWSGVKDTARLARDGVKDAAKSYAEFFNNSTVGTNNASGATGNGTSGASSATGTSGQSGTSSGASKTSSGNTYGSWLQNFGQGVKDTAGAAWGGIKDAAKSYAEFYKNSTTGENNASGTTGSGTVTSEGTKPVDSYEQFLNNKETASGSTGDEDKRYDHAEEQRNAAYAAAENQRIAAEERADVERERSIVDARSSYEQNKASYGANAEAMSSMGLSGGGYSEYLNSQAYAQQRAEIQAANAQADATKREASYTEEQLRQQADSEYHQNKYEEAQYARSAYAELLSGANSGAYTVEQLKQLAADHGLSDAQTQSLINAANEYNYGYDVGTHSVDTAEIDKAYRNGEISEAQYNDFKSKWNSNIDLTADTFRDEQTGELMTKSEAEKILNDTINDPWCSEAVRGALQSEFNDLYTPKINGENYNGSDSELADVGNNFKVKLGGKTYRVESAGKCTDANVKEVASGVPNGRMFGYQGHVYIKSNGEIYEIRKRSNSAQDDWNTVWAALCG